MATITPKILKQNKKSDGTWNVVFRLTHDRKSRYIKTSHFIDESQIVGEDEIEIDFVIDHLAKPIKAYRKKIDEIENIGLLSVDDVLEILTRDKRDIDFLCFIKYHIDKLKEEGRNSTTKPFTTVFNSLSDYVGHPLYCSKITSKFLKGYAEFLRKPRLIKRNQGVNIIEKETKLNEKGLHNHMSAFRTLFNAAKEHYNDEDTGLIVIKNNPFSSYKIAPKKNKKHKNINLEGIRLIRDFNAGTIREQLGKDMFMLSFYMCGMNAVDIFNNWDRLKKLPKRIGYNRSKTEGKREDHAFISVLIPDQAKEIINRLEINYSSINILNNTISIGLRSLNKSLGFPELTMLHSRHSFATIARNDLNISKDDVAIALNHVNEENRITDTYIAPDWSKIDRVQEQVIGKLNEY